MIGGVEWSGEREECEEEARLPGEGEEERASSDFN